MKHAAIALALLPFLSACGSGPAPQRYLLTAPLPANPGAQEARTRVALERVGIPGYLEEDRIASEAPGPRIVYDEDDRWAEDPRVAITRAVEGTLSAEPGLIVLAEPWPRRFRPDVKVQVDFDRFLRSADGGVSMSGHFIVMAGDGDEVLTIEPFALTQGGALTRAGEGGVPTYDVFFSAASQAIQELSDQIVRALPEPEAPEAPEAGA